MSICRRMQCNGLVVLMLVLVISSQAVSATRPMKGYHPVSFHGGHVGALDEILGKGPITPSGPTGCTKDPNNHGGNCPPKN